MIIGISGKRGSGKDMLAKYLVPYGFEVRSFAQTLKSEVRELFKLTKEHTDGELKESHTCYIKSIWPEDAGPEDTCVVKLWTPREIMIAYGQFFRQFDKDWWIKRTLLSIDQNSRIVVPDVRFKNEADYIKRMGGVLIRLERKLELNIYKTQLHDVSETELDKYENFDFVLDANHNIYPTDLQNFAVTIVRNIGVIS